MKPLSLMDVLVPFARKDDWIFNAPFVPAPKEQAWASENGVKFHIETALSNDKAGQEFTALCGVKGDYLHQRGASQNFMRCEKCLELSSVTGIDVAARNDGLSCSTVTYGATGGEVDWIPASPRTSLDAAPEKYIGRFDSSTNHFMEFVGARLADAAFIRSAQFWKKIIAKGEDVSLAEGYRLEELDAERESLGVR